MSTLKTIELKAFVPAKDFELSKQFYQDVGFTLASDSDGIASFRQDNVSFFLQNFYVKELAENFMMHLSVENVDAWWAHIQARSIATKYGVKTLPPGTKPVAYAGLILSIPQGVMANCGKIV